MKINLPNLFIFLIISATTASMLHHVGASFSVRFTYLCLISVLAIDKIVLLKDDDENENNV